MSNSSISEYEDLAQGIAGEIALSEGPGRIMKKWREKFQVPQKELADHLEISPSVISDYESGRRTSPRVETIRKFVDALLLLDQRRGSPVSRGLKRIVGTGIPPDILLDLRKFQAPIKVRDFCEYLHARIVAGKDFADREVWGYTAINSVAAILRLDVKQLFELQRQTSGRAAIFTNVSTGRSPLVAIKSSQIGFQNRVNPTLIVLHGLDPNRVDIVALKISETERIPLAVSTIKGVDELVRRLRTFNS
ncbi:MAG: helix-turn-helix domain-containing protein [Promethearchaeati archaeon SRVP18_Atabeyarchaeia-1]